MNHVKQYLNIMKRIKHYMDQKKINLILVLMINYNHHKIHM